MAKRLKSIRAKLKPEPALAVTPYLSPRPSAEPSLLYQKLSRLSLVYRN
jgi:hypothetical protein